MIVNVVEEIWFFIMEIKLACRWMPLEPCRNLLPGQTGTIRTERHVQITTIVILAFVTLGKMGASVPLLKRASAKHVKPGTIVISLTHLTVVGAGA